MDYSKFINESISYIDAHLTEDLSASTISKAVGYSTYHFCRIFKQYKGITVMKYVRYRRLKNACIDLKCGEKYSSVFYKYGFESESGFVRAIRKYINDEKYGE